MSAPGPLSIAEESWRDHTRLSNGAAVERLIETTAGVQETFGYLVKVGAEECEIVMTVAGRHLNIADNLHGGVVCTLLDAACSYACVRHADPRMAVPVVTLSLTTQFVGTVQQGRLLTRARVLGGGRKTLFAEGEIYSQDGRLLAKANGNWKLLQRRTESDGDGTARARSLG